MKITIERRVPNFPDFAQSVFDNVMRIPFPDIKDGEEVAVTQLMINGMLTMLGSYTSVLAHLLVKHEYPIEEATAHLVAAFGVRKTQKDLSEAFRNLWLQILSQPVEKIEIELGEESS